MVSDMQSLIVVVMSGNDFPSVPPINKMNTEIGSAEAMKSANIDDSENLDASAAADDKLTELVMAMSLRRASSKPGKYVRT